MNDIKASHFGCFDSSLPSFVFVIQEENKKAYSTNGTRPAGEESILRTCFVLLLVHCTIFSAHSLPQLHGFLSSNAGMGSRLQWLGGDGRSRVRGFSLVSLVLLPGLLTFSREVHGVNAGGKRAEWHCLGISGDAAASPLNEASNELRHWRRCMK